MSDIKYNQFGEVVSVNGLTTGHHIGAPMQDAIGTPEENQLYVEELSTVRNGVETPCLDEPQNTNDGGSGGSGGNNNELVIIIKSWANDYAISDYEMNMTFDKVRTDILAGNITSIKIINNLGNEYAHSVDNVVYFTHLSPDDGMSFGIQMHTVFVDTSSISVKRYMLKEDGLTVITSKTIS